MLAWGKKFTVEEKAKLVEIASQLEMPPADGPDNIAACIAWESGETFSPAVKNKAGSGATGVIQFMPDEAIALGTTVQQLERMTLLQQLFYVYKHFLPYKGRLQTLSDTYMAILWPRAIGKPDDYVLWDQVTRPTTYRQNSGLDINSDKAITKGEAAAKVYQKLLRGRLPQFLG